MVGTYVCPSPPGLRVGASRWRARSHSVRAGTSKSMDHWTVHGNVGTLGECTEGFRYHYNILPRLFRVSTKYTTTYPPTHSPRNAATTLTR